MNKEEIDLINNLSSAVGKSAEFVTGEYAKWHVASSIGFIAFGLAICYAAYIVNFEDEENMTLFVKGVLYFFGLLFVACNIGDLFQPNAAAIHQLISDLRGK